MLPSDPIPAKGFTLTQGRKPRTGDTMLKIQLRSGFIDDQHEYTAAQLRWDDTGSDADIIAVRKA